jgi:hypothetical protein
MPWWAWAGVVVYAGVWRITFRVVWGDYPKSDWDGVLRCMFAATSLSWLVGLVLLFEKTSDRLKPDQVARAIGGEGRAHKRKRREPELRELETRMRLAEKELGIDGEAVCS